MFRFFRATALFIGVVLLRASPVLLILGSPLVVVAIWRAGM
ncbi:hypothetical protein [Aureimonas mangrovi]|nr:hypothetical protein [Aureimonas mangrovi]